MFIVASNSDRGCGDALHVGDRLSARIATRFRVALSGRW